MITTRKYSLTYSPLSKRILTGRHNKARTAFLDKEDVTGMAVAAVAEYIHGGGFSTVSRDGKTHFKITVEVVENAPSSL